MTNDRLSIRRQIENEVVFRQANERVQRGLEKLKKMAESDGSIAIDIDEIPLHFYCECSDENCHERIVLKPSVYNELHTNRKQFIIKPSHEVPPIESVVHKRADYLVVRKKITPPEKVNKLSPTNIDSL